MWFGFLVWLAALLPAAFALVVMVKVSASFALVAALEPLLEYTIYGAGTGPALPQSRRAFF